MEQELIRLVRLNNDTYRVYQNLTEFIQNKNFKNFIGAYSVKRKRFAEELERKILKYGINSNGKVKQSQDSTYSTEQYLTDNNLVKSLIVQENRALRDYEGFLKSGQMPLDIQTLAIKHITTISAAEKTLRELEPIVHLNEKEPKKTGDQE